MNALYEMYDKSNEKYGNIIKQYNNRTLSYDDYKELDTMYKTELNTLKQVIELVYDYKWKEN